MPFYDLRCTSCKNEFNIMASMRDKSEKNIPCPDCGSIELETVYKAAPHIIRSASGDCPNSHVCGSGCCHGR